MTLADYVEKSGITTYEKLLIVCDRQFVLPPSKDNFDKTIGRRRSNPSEGVAIIMPDVVQDDEFPDVLAVEEPPKKTKKKKPSSSTSSPAEERAE